ncbi:MAG: GNAT family N-acetyltransferase [Gammaproteobacteria bacterium]|nr:GNAT family N-acetyltransferase [Gammaproteobacteria bacterium]
MSQAAVADPICPQYIPRVTYRAARSHDARALARLTSIGSGGVEDCAWSEEAKPGESLFEVGRRRLARTQPTSSFQNCRVAEIDGAPIGMIIGYSGGEVAACTAPSVEPVDANSYFIETVAVFSQWRSHGVGTRFLALAEQDACRAGFRQTMVRVFAENRRAVRLFTRLGYVGVHDTHLEPNPLIQFPGALSFMTKHLR